VRLALLGAPGSGKGTQAVRLARHFGVPLIATGELLRRRAATGGGPSTVELADQLARGELVPDDIVVSVVNDALRAASAKGGYVLDGFPRTVGQARDPGAPELDAVIHLDVPDDVAARRIAERAGEGRSDDARRDATARRLRTFHVETDPVLELYRRRGIVTTVDSTQPPDQVTEAILAAPSVRSLDGS
jgi:adenylate kinase